MTASHASITDLIPHAGCMVLLEDILHWDAKGVLCRTNTHRSLGNPLRRRDTLPAIAGIEYGAQAAAVHGALMGQIAGGYLVSVKDCQVDTKYLSDHLGPLLVSATRLMTSKDALIYRIVIEEESDSISHIGLLAGQITVMLNSDDISVST